MKLNGELETPATLPNKLLRPFASLTRTGSFLVARSPLRVPDRPI